MKTRIEEIDEIYEVFLGKKPAPFANYSFLEKHQYGLSEEPSLLQTPSIDNLLVDHPIMSKVSLLTVQQLMREGQIIELEMNQNIYSENEV